MNQKIKNVSQNKTKSEKIEQPELLSGGTLRDYQLKGLNWLISLYENGLNGILADEMGLGKTIQTIALLAHLWSKGIQGPFLVVAPLSTLSNWVNEFQKWTPTIPVILYHAKKVERKDLRDQISEGTKSKSSKSKRQFPVVITSYDLAIRDILFLKKYNWKYLVVDEAHRLKNFECKLIQKLKVLVTGNRLLLTGTPLQNNLKELWSLLNFILPDIFDNLANFQKWFDVDVVIRKSIEGETLDETKQRVTRTIISKLHTILQPFMMRRMKNEVEEFTIPKKKEILIYCPFQEVQKAFYDLLLHREYFSKAKANEVGIKKISLNNVIMQLRKICNHPFLFDDDYDDFEVKYEKAKLEGRDFLLLCGIDKNKLHEQNRKDNEADGKGRDEKSKENGNNERRKVKSKKTKESSESTSEEKQVKPRSKSEMNTSTTKRVNVSDSSEESEDKVRQKKSREKKRKKISGLDLGDILSHKRKKSRVCYNEEDTWDSIFNPDAEQEEEEQKEVKTTKKHVKKTNAFELFCAEYRSKADKATQVKEISPLWRDLPQDEKDKFQKMADEKYLSDLSKIDSNLLIENPEEYLLKTIKHSGKFELLSRILPELKKKGHKVLLFSQMTRMLDVLEDFLDYSGYQYQRIDGNTTMTRRQELITCFNSDPEQFIFLLSTRAAGLGINLTSADTVIIYDSDWNPQMDLQAMDRCHRIGQTKPVCVFRLMVAGSIESRMRSVALSKLKLEGLVVKRKNAVFSEEDLVNLLNSEHIDGTVGSGENHITEEELTLLLDRDKIMELMNDQNITTTGGFTVVEQIVGEF
uniref:Uncharacterized protein n=1 Tax=Arcella intermedia TaxID=1963864 RepID=A0A6B2KXV6_9EUKA